MMVLTALRPTKADDNAPAESRRRLFRSSFSSASAPEASRATGINLSTALFSASNVFHPAKEPLPDLSQLNDALVALAAIFPDVKPEVFREMLSTFSGDSRLHVVAEQLIKHKAKWVKGRWRLPSNGSKVSSSKEVQELDKSSGDADYKPDQELVPLEEKFRSETYKEATKTALYTEFRTLSRSTVDGILAEHNHCYTQSRPVLLGLAAKSWKTSLSTFLMKWRKPPQEVADKHYMLIWKKSPDGVTSIPTLRETGDPELDLELQTTILNPLLLKRSLAQEAINIELATLLNEQEAEHASALYECECCFSDTTFEAMATCTTGAHTICFTCIRHAVSEALYGQSWGLNIDHIRGQIACLAPTSTTPCTGCIPHALSQRAILSSPSNGPQTWAKLQSRLASSELLKSQLPLITCPFCTYAELDDVYLPHPPIYRPNTSTPFLTLALIILTLDLAPLILLYILLSHILPTHFPPLTNLLTNALTTLTRSTHLSPRFLCRSPTCARASCINCKKTWIDPHICHESATLSLRTTIEAARTAALKRTCPRCGLGFVKDSGCNKMVCVCGYTMCYICRQGLGRKSAVPIGQQARRGLDLARDEGGGGGGGVGVGGVGRVGGPRVNEGGPVRPNADGDEDDGFGYRHFCQHFRPAGGRCTECDRCDLYRGEDEDELVKRAGERAEKEWREREGLGADVVRVEEGRGGKMRRWIGGMGREWGWQEVVDWWVGVVVKC
jgi:hypothetical protein